MAFRVHCDRLMRYAEIRPYDGAWTMLATGREHATPFRTREEAEEAIPAIVEACAGWRITADDLRVTTDEGVPLPLSEQHKAYIKRFFANTDAA